MVNLPMKGYVYREIRNPENWKEIRRMPGMTDITISSTESGIVLSWFEPKNKKIVALYTLLITIESMAFWVCVVLLVVLFWWTGARSVWEFLLLRGVIL